MFRKRYLLLIPILFNFIIVFPSLLLSADTVDVPVTLSYPFLNQLLTLTVFNSPGKTVEFTSTSRGCTKIILSEPRLSEVGNALRLVTQARAIIGMESEDDCTPLMEWKGKTEAIALPMLLNKPTTAVGLELKDVNLYSQKGERSTSGIIWDSFQGYLCTLLDQFIIDFGPSLNELTALLPLILPRHSTKQMAQIINSLHLTRVQVQSEGVTVDMDLTLEPLPAPATVPEPALTKEEIQRWETQWESWDAFLTFIIKKTAAATASESLHTTLLEILLDARYEFREALLNDSLHKEDPVRALFVRSWQRLVPVLQEIGATLPGQEALSLLSFLTAGNAMQVLDRIGPSVGLDISTDGLRRLARLMGESPGVDPLRYVEEEDPELRRLFGFKAGPEEQNDPKKIKLNLRLIPEAFAENSPKNPFERLNSWVPTIPELSQYLPMVRKLLDQKVQALIRKVDIRPEVASVYQKLVLTASWQESCWRQYVVEKNKLAPLRSSTGDVGMMQINERVWHGFYAIDKLRWDIGYNVQAGCEILLKYLVDYVIPKGEHTEKNLHNLARATYSAYNGGPSQINRFRDPNPAPMHRKIDHAFWEKYQAVQRGEEYNVAECLGGTNIEVKAESSPPVSIQKGARAQDSKQENWILSQNPKHFTLQIAALSTENTLQEFTRKLPNPEHAAFFRMNRDGKPLYIVLYGTYAQRAEAEKAAQRYGFDKPWLRDFGSLQAIIKKK